MQIYHLVLGQKVRGKVKCESFPSQRKFMKKISVTRNVIINLVLVLTVAAVLTVFAFSVQVRTIPDSAVVQQTLDMTCGSCCSSKQRK